MDCAVAGRTRPEHCNASDEESMRKQFHDGEHGVKVEEGGPQQSGRVAGEGGSRDCSALQVPSGVLEKEESPCFARDEQRIGQKRFVLLALM